jgi:short-subunit dehydrogenase involved in D-alanine esterification of teichoic acids
MNSNKIHKDDKEAFRRFVEMINETHEDINVHVSFTWLNDAERFSFRVNNKLVIKDTIDTAIAFLDGILLTLDVLALLKED